MYQDLVSRIFGWLEDVDPITITGPDIESTFPMPDIDSVRLMCVDVVRILEDEHTVMDVAPPVLIVGDIHGHVSDLIRILKSGFDEKYLFLGDYVDRGLFSVEVVIIMLAAKLRYPDKFIFVRGNHEMSEQCVDSGFQADVMRRFNSKATYLSLVNVFSFLPLAAIVDNRWLCVHGGLGLCDMSVSVLRAIKRPITKLENIVVTSLLWSDPSDEVAVFKPSPRGLGFVFGARVVNAYLEGNQLSGIIRAHQVVKEGVRKQFDGKVITVFSASNYCGRIESSCGILQVTEEGLAEAILEPLPFLTRTGTQLPVSAFDLRAGPHIVRSAGRKRVESRTPEVSTAASKALPRKGLVYSGSKRVYARSNEPVAYGFRMIPRSVPDPK